MIKIRLTRIQSVLIDYSILNFSIDLVFFPTYLPCTFLALTLRFVNMLFDVTFIFELFWSVIFFLLFSIV